MPDPGVPPPRDETRVPYGEGSFRRACCISLARAGDVDAVPDAGAYMPVAAGSGHGFTPGIAEHARRVRGMTRESTHRPEALLADAEARRNPGREP